MVTKARDEEPVEEAEPLYEKTWRVAVSGHPQGATRRIFLYVITFGLIASGTYAFLAIIPLALLFGTDQIA